MLHQIKHAHELGEHDAFGSGFFPLHAVDFLQKGLDLGAAAEGPANPLPRDSIQDAVASDSDSPGCSHCVTIVESTTGS